VVFCHFLAEGNFLEVVVAFVILVELLLFELNLAMVLILVSLVLLFLLPFFARWLKARKIMEIFSFVN
jgi:hypothetical protein